MISLNESKWDGPERRNHSINEAHTNQSTQSAMLTDRLSYSARAVTISPADRSQYGSHSGERTDKQQHGQSNYQEKCRSHVVQNRDHITSLLLLDASTAPSTDADPWTHWIDFLKWSPATRTLPSPHLPHMLTSAYSYLRFPTAISVKPVHWITLFPVKCRSCSARGPCRFPLGPTSTCPQPIVNAAGAWNHLASQQKFTSI